jgi:DNA mismatch repair ATPase MutS
LAASIIQFLLDEKKPYMICSTHYHELFDLIDSSSVLWAYMGYHMTKEQIQFLYALLPGVAQNSMGIALAEEEIDSSQKNLSTQKIIDALKNIEIDELTPRKALDLVAELKDFLL